MHFFDWTHRFRPADQPRSPTPVIDPENQFLQGLVDKDDMDNVPTGALFKNNDGTGGVITPTLLNLRTAIYDENLLRGDAKNGVGFFNGVSSRQEGSKDVYFSHYYAGIFSGTDLGAPLTAETATGEWRGQFGVVGKKRFYNDEIVKDSGGSGQLVTVIDDTGTVEDIDFTTDFTLEVTFGNTPGAAGKVAAFVAQDSTNHIYYHLDGTYDGNGVISGTVDYGGFTDGDRTRPTTPVALTVDHIRLNGTLTGLIGQKGAVGVFISNTDTEAETRKTGELGFAGGFVACPYDTATNQCKQ